MSSRRKVLRCLVVTAFAAGALACESGPPEDGLASPAVASAFPEVTRCAGPAPAACLAGCGLGPTAAVPRCDGGLWRCDAGIMDTACPAFEDPCTLASPCSLGYTCVKSMTHPVPSDAGICRKGTVLRDNRIESCQDFGVLSPSELAAGSGALVGGIVKFSGRVGMSLKCSKDACPKDSPCCNDCVGNYVVELVDPVDPAARVTMLVRTELLPCSGSNCDVSCTPLLIGDTYKLWGLLEGCTGGQCTLLYMGACPL